MRNVGTLFILIGILFGVLGIRSFWRDYRFEKARTVTKAQIVLVSIEPIRSGLSNILYTMAYTRDGIIDTTTHKITEEFTNKYPLPSLEQLQSATWYVHYVPKERREETAFPNRTMVLDNEDYPGINRYRWFTNMLSFIIIGSLMRAFFRKKCWQDL